MKNKFTKWFILFMLFCSFSSFAQIDLMDYNGYWYAQHTPVSGSNSVTQLVDNDNSSYLSVAQNTSWVMYKSYSPFSIKTYTLTAAGTSSSFDPTSWILEGSKDSSTWVLLDQQNSQTFSARGQKNSYSIATDSLFRYFRLTLTNTNTATINLAEWELQLSSNWNGFVLPTINISTAGSGTTTGEQVFFQAMNVSKALQVCLGVNQLLYKSNSEVPAFTTLNLIVDPNYAGISAKSGAPPAITIVYGGNYINSIYSSSGLEATLKEILGIMYHETTHGYTQAPNNSGPYSNNTNQHTFVEGIADYVRYRAGYIPITNRGATSWWSGYNPAAFFIDWLNNKNPNFSYLFNLTSRTIPSWTWDKAVNQILGVSTESLWREYQVYLKNTGSNLIPEFTSLNRFAAVNTPVVFKNLSANATGYNWTFPGGTPATSTAVNPSVTYSQPGVYSVLLSVNKSGLSTQKGDTGYVVIGLSDFSRQYGITANNTPVTTEQAFSGTDSIPLTKLLMYDSANTKIECWSYTPIILKAYVFQGNNLGDTPKRFPNAWKLRGSNDLVNWNVIDAQANQVHPNYDYGRIIYNVPNNNTPYIYYRIDSMSNLINGGTSDFIALSEVELYSNKVDTGYADITDDGGLLTAQYQTGSPNGEDYTKIIDNDNYSKYLTFNCSAWVQYQATSSYIAKRYSLVSANDEPTRDPKSWTFQGSNDGINWFTLDTRTNQTFASRNLEQYYMINNNVPYQYYRFNFVCNGATMFQMSEFRIWGQKISCFADANSNLANASTTSSLIQNGSISYYGHDCQNLFAALQASGPSPASGVVDANFWLESTQPANYVRRHFQITPQINANSSSGRVTLYATQTDFDNFNAVNQVKLPTDQNDATGISHLRIEKRSGTSSDSTGLPNSYAGTSTIIDPADADIIWNATLNRWEISFDVTSFSGFWIASSSIPLPLKLTGFNAVKLNGLNKITWTTIGELNIKSFVLETSIDGINFNFLTQQNSKGGGNYNFTDSINFNPSQYYRLKIINEDGSFFYSNVILIKSVNNDGGINIYPNPGKGLINLNLTQQSLLNTEAVLSDLNGKMIQRIKMISMNQSLNLTSLNSGIYLLKFADGAFKKIIINN